MENIREITSWKWIFQWRKRGAIYDNIKNNTERDDYWKYVGEIAIVEKKICKQSPHLLEEDKIEWTWQYYITCETSRWSRLYRKYIPKKVLPLFMDILEIANAKWVYRNYDYVLYS